MVLVTSMFRNKTRDTVVQELAKRISIFTQTYSYLESSIRISSFLSFCGSPKKSLSERKYLIIFIMSFAFYLLLNRERDMLVGGKKCPASLFS